MVIIYDMDPDDIRTQRNLFILAAFFLGIFALAVTLAPAVSARDWDVTFTWSHWIGYLVWLCGFTAVHLISARYLKVRDPMLLPLVGIISGWGLLTIWRLTPTFGLRQTGWMALSLLVLSLGMRLPSLLSLLRRYKYIWLTSGLILTSLTLIFGTNPMGFGPRLWLGWGGIYLQPSEPLKLLLVVYLAAYFADWSTILVSHHDDLTIPVPPVTPNDSRFISKKKLLTYPQFQILLPTLVMTGLAVLMLLIQRDLGTASIFIFLYSVMVFLVTRWLWVPAASTAILGIAGVFGYRVFDVIRLRVDAWINPWLDPSGRSYQIVQSLLAVAEGGIFGRGPGLGHPTLVPITHSDFIFAAIAEDTGLVGVVGLLVLLGLLTWRGLRIAVKGYDKFHRYLAAGLTTFLIAQSLLIIGGNLRLLPLTGVTLPFISYGGSSLLVSFVIITILVHIKNESVSGEAYGEASQESKRTGNFQNSLPYIAAFLLLGLFATSLIAGWWGVIRGPDLLTRTDNPRRGIADLTIPRGAILDRSGEPIVESVEQDEVLRRILHYPDLGPITGYTHPVYGQSGLESSLDPFLRGIDGNDPITIWWNRLLYGQPPPGLDVRLTIDLDLQAAADELLTTNTGALILMNAENGEILAMSSHPTYDPNQLEAQWDQLLQDERSPLVNRTTQALYSIGDLATAPFINVASETEPGTLSLRLPMAVPKNTTDAAPLEIATYAAALSNMGIRPAPILVQFMEKPEGGWTLLPSLSTPNTVMTSVEAAEVLEDIRSDDGITWGMAYTPDGENLTWYLGGTTSTWAGLPLVIVLVVEQGDMSDAEFIGQSVLLAAMGP